MKAEIIDISNILWQDVLQQVRHDIYQLPEYLALEAKRTKTIPEALLITEGDKIFFVPYLLRNCNDVEEFTLSDIFDIYSPYGYPGILVNQEAMTLDFLDAAFKNFQDVLKSRGICSVFLRMHPILNEQLLETCLSSNFTLNGETVSINLKLSEPEIWAHTRKGHQSTINKCKRLGFTARTVSFSEYYKEFTEIYEETMNRVKANQSYYFDDDYFNQLLSLQDKLHLCIVEFEGEVICTSLFFESCGIVQAHLGGTKNDLLSQSPFNLLLHHARLWAKERGNDYLHIGGGIGGSTTDSLHTFKSGFSRQRHKFFTLRLVTDEEKFIQLVELRAKALETQPEILLQSGFFPAYRYTVN